MRKSKILESEYIKIVDLYQNGLTQYDIASIYNVRQGSISYILKKMGVNALNKRYLQFSYNEVLDMYYMYSSGVSAADIAVKYNICTDSVYNLFTKYDFEIKSISHAKQQYKINENYFDEIDTPNKAYIIGLLYADGCNMTDKHEVTISLQERDKHILEQIKNELRYDGPLRFIDYNTKNPNHQNQYKLDITNKHISESLNKLGVWKNKSLILEWPEWLDKKLYSHFVRGYFDGDGSLYFDRSNNATVSFVSTEMFLNRLQEIVKRQLDINLYMYDRNDKYKSVTKESKINSQQGIKVFLDWIYRDADLMLYRKHDKYQQFLNNINNSCCA